MAETFFDRLRQYYLSVAKVLRGEADAASIFPNTTDKGMSREKVYAEFLRLHLPSKCNIFFGGFLFDHSGAESRQLDVIITADTVPQFNLNNKDGTGKSFSTVEGTIGIASIKSMLNKEQLEDALWGIASIPPTQSLDGRISMFYKLQDYDDWPYKIIYSLDGISLEQLSEHLKAFYTTNSHIPLNRRPHLIHIAGKYISFRATNRMTLWDPIIQKHITPQPGEYSFSTDNPDLQAILWTLTELQQNAVASTQILFSFPDIINKIGNVPTP